MPDLTLDALLAKQKEMSDLAATLAGESNVDRIQEMAAELGRRGEELERMAQELVAQHGNPKQQRGSTEVVLTAAQRQRVLDETGVTLETILIPDDAGIATRTMPTT